MLLLMLLMLMLLTPMLELVLTLLSMLDHDCVCADAGAGNYWIVDKKKHRSLTV